MTDSFNNKNIKNLEISEDRGQYPVVLIVDDDGDSREMLKVLLEIWKYRVIEVDDGIEAVSLAEKSFPDLILMDVRLPRLDGFGITQQIRESAKLENVPIIFLSGCADVSSKQKGYDVGGNEYLTKPLNFQELENTLDKYVCRSQKF